MKLEKRFGLHLRLLLLATIVLGAHMTVARADVALQQVLQGLSSPVYVANAHDGTHRLFVVQQPGQILVLAPGTSTPTLFLDISSKVVFNGEQGLLGLAFHPQFAANSRFFVDYTRASDGATVIAEYHASLDPNATRASETVLLVIPQPYANHNGGMLEFGPDGYLYIGMGDGGSANDPENRAQNINELLGKILRIDVDHPANGVPYSSPPGNPYVGATPGRDEIFAVGMRNPFRFSFDRQTGQLYVADVGQSAVEEIDIVTAGGNYGWRVYEGTQCTNLDPQLCNPANYVAPIAQYTHTGGRCAIIGGYVYRGTAGTLATGTYVSGDLCTGEIFTLSGGTLALLLDTNLSISSFGEDESGEIYVVGLGGTVDRLALDTGSATTLASSANPAGVGSNVTFTATVMGSNPTGSVIFTEGGSPLSGCSATVALSGSGNTRTAACTTASLAMGTHNIVATYSGDSSNAGSSSAVFVQTIDVAGIGNVALASAGAVASASSTFSALYPVSSVIDNERAGVNWNNGGGWADATANVWPDWVQINFNGNKTINRVVLYTVQDNYANPIEPTDTLTFAQYGITDFTVQGWNGSTWVTLATVAGNNLIKRTVTFTAFTTDRIRVNVTHALFQYATITEIEAWGVAAASLPATTTTLTSSANPATVGSGVTFTVTVTGVSGSNPTGSVTFTEGSNPLSGCAAAVTLSGGGDTKTAACTTASLGLGTHNVVATYGGDVANAGSSSAALAQNITDVAGSSNVALASAGAVASASSTFSALYPVSSVIDNERAGVNWNNGGGWADATANVWPDWVQINFNGNKTINRVVLYTVQDNYANPIEPTDTLTFAQYGITDFTVQGWNGSTWVTLATVAGNNLIKRTVTFTAFTTDRIRVNVTHALFQYATITEIEAWGVAAASLPATTTTLTSSANPATVGSGVTFTVTVTGVSGSNPTGSVTFTEGSNPLSGCAAAVALSGSGNTKTAACTTANLGVGTHNVVATYGGDAANAGSSSAALAQNITDVAGSSNVALASAGAVASASSTFSALYPVSSVIDNERAGVNWNNGGGWADATANVWPDWVQINFNGNKTINRVVLYTVQDNYANPIEPTDTLTFAQYGITDFTVQGWNGSTWVTLATVAGNNLIKRTVTFTAFTTDRIRVNVTHALFQYATITEIEAWGS